MMKLFMFAIAFCCVSSTAFADTLIAARTIRANTIVTAQDVAWIEDQIPGMASSLDQIVGLEAKSILYTGRPIALGDLGPAAVIERNQIIPLVFSMGGLTIRADGRSMERAGPGEVVRVMNLSSKSTVSGVVAPDGSVHVGGLTY